MNRSLALGIEISNPSSGPRGRIDRDPQSIAGPGVALGRFETPGTVEIISAEALSETSRHDDDLMPAIARLCARCHVQPGNLDHIAVSIGPGGYTSLRIAIATSKMLAEATGASTIPIPSAAVAAWRIAPLAPAIVCIASKKQTAWCELLPPEPESPWWTSIAPMRAQLLSPPTQAKLEEHRNAGRHWIAARQALGILDAAALESLQPRAIIADHFLPAPMREAAKRLGASIIEPHFAAASVLELAVNTPAIDPLALAPLYPREPDAVTQWKRRS